MISRYCIRCSCILDNSDTFGMCVRCRVAAGLGRFMPARRGVGR